MMAQTVQADFNYFADKYTVVVGKNKLYKHAFEVIENLVKHDQYGKFKDFLGDDYGIIKEILEL